MRSGRASSAALCVSGLTSSRRSPRPRLGFAKRSPADSRRRAEPCGCRRSSARGGSRDRPRAPRRRRAGGRLDPELHGLRGGDGGVVRRPVRGARARRAVAAGRGGARERARDPRRHRRRPDADVQRAHGHVVLGPRALARRDPRLPAGGVRARGADLRARDLEHEGRARRLPRGGAGARRRGAEGRRHDRGGRRRDREDPAGRGAGRGVPRLRGRLAPPRRARRRRRHVHPRRADRAEARARALRHALAPALHVRPVHPHRLLLRAARGELDRAHARRARARARVAAGVGGGDELRRRPRRRERRRDPGRLRLARLADAAPDRPLPRPARAAGRRDGGGAAEGARRSRARSTASRRRST